eukprot:TRINITY_DN79135_c0_g1_i1.p1 TRINITY_DN79135_c0_g1~~TRINITY_DN79135_c0_g1_i1.p1  ORF type:complete len:286 (+),score=58.98 TRINITY_DN79135_c0_g1_i1:42-899(+)
MGNRSSNSTENNSSSAGPRPAAPVLPPITISAVKLGGEAVSIEISPSQTVRQLKELLAPKFQIGACQCKLIFETSPLKDASILADVGLLADAEVSMIVMPSIPAWAEGLGLSGEHPAMLRDYYTKHGLDLTAKCDEDDGAWEVLKDARDKVETSKTTRDNWNHDILIRQNGVPTSLLTAAPGEKLTIEVTGSIWNKNSDSCIHQLLLVLDKEIIAELSDGVPGRGRDIHGSHSFKAPSEPGKYMLWKTTQLQYSMRDARRSVEAAIGGRVLSKYPGAFVGWLVVT